MKFQTDPGESGLRTELTEIQQEIELCIVSLGFLPTRGGVELRFRRYLPGLHRRGIHPQVLSGTPESKKIIESDKQQLWYGRPVGEVLTAGEIDGTPVSQIRLPDRDPVKRLGLLSRELLRICQKPNQRPDVVQLLSKLRPSAAPCLSKLKKMGIPVVYAYTSLGRWPSNPIKRAFRMRVFRGLCHKVDCIIASSTNTQEILVQLGVKTRIEVIPNGVDLKRFAPAGDEQMRRSLRAALGIKQNARVILSIGAIHPRKGIDLLLEAWVSLAKRFSDAHLYLIGMRHDINKPELAAFKRRLDALISASKASERVHFKGFVQNVEDYLKAADLLVFPSRKEGMGNAVLEAMACGLPCVLTPFVGLPPDFGKPGQEYRLVNHDPVELASGVARILSDQDLRSRLGHNARRWVEKTMDIELVLDRYAALYRDLVKSNRYPRLLR